jgi:hypothetical protein
MGKLNTMLNPHQNLLVVGEDLGLYVVYKLLSLLAQNILLDLDAGDVLLGLSLNYGQKL